MISQPSKSPTTPFEDSLLLALNLLKLGREALSSVFKATISVTIHTLYHQVIKWIFILLSQYGMESVTAINATSRLSREGLIIFWGRPE